MSRLDWSVLAVLIGLAGAGIFTWWALLLGWGVAGIGVYFFSGRGDRG